MKKFLNNEEIKSMTSFHCPRFEELPSIGLYKDQVISYIEEVLKPFRIIEDESLITPTMLNNYVKQKIVSPPKNRRYDEKHIAYLIVVCLLKQIYSLNEICELIRIQIDTAPISNVYDFFCIELEKAIKFVFSNNSTMGPSSAKINTIETELVRYSAIALSNKIFIQKYLIYENRFIDK